MARAAAWSVFSSLPQPLLAVPAFLFVDAFEPLLPVGLGFAGGAMVWMVFHEIVPDALEEASKDVVATVLTVSMVAMLVFQALLRGAPSSSFTVGPGTGVVPRGEDARSASAAALQDVGDLVQERPDRPRVLQGVPGGGVA